MIDFVFRPNYDHVVNESDWSEFVSDVYSRPYNLQQMEMLANESFVVLDVPEYSPTDEKEVTEMLNEISKWVSLWEDRQGSSKPDWHKKMDAERDDFIDRDLIAWDLHRRGLIPAGRYLMEISW